MTRTVFRVAAVMLAAALVAAPPAVVRAWGGQTTPPPDPKPRPDLVRQPYSEADVTFMTGMIPHHAQAVIMAGWAPSHGARADVAILCERIVVGQTRRDPIDAATGWRDRGAPVPDAKSTRIER